MIWYHPSLSLFASRPLHLSLFSLRSSACVRGVRKACHGRWAHNMRRSARAACRPRMVGFTRHALCTCLRSVSLRAGCAQSLPRTVGTQRALECARCMPSAYGRLHPIHALCSCVRSASLCPWGCSTLCAALLTARLRLTPLPPPLSFPARVRCSVAPPMCPFVCLFFYRLVCLSVFGPVCHLNCFLTSLLLSSRRLAPAASLPVIPPTPRGLFIPSCAIPPLPCGASLLC